MRGTKARMPWMTPHRLMSMTRCHSSRRELPRVATVDHAGVVHGHVELAELLDGGGTDALDRVGIAHVDADRQDLGTLVA